MTIQPTDIAWDFGAPDFADWDLADWDIDDRDFDDRDEDADEEILGAAVHVPDRDTLGALSLEERTDIIDQYVRQELARVLGIAPNAVETAGCTMNSLGVGSVVGLQIQNRMETALGVEVNLQMLLLANSAAELIECLAGQLGPGDSVHARRSRRTT